MRFAGAMKRAKARAPERGVRAASAQSVLAAPVQPMIPFQKAIGDPWCHVTEIPMQRERSLSLHPAFGHPLPRWGEGRVRALLFPGWSASLQRSVRDTTLALKLEFVESLVNTAAFDQFGMFTGLHDAPLVEHHDEIGFLHGGKPVRNANGRATDHQFLQ